MMRARPANALSSADEKLAGRALVEFKKRIPHAIGLIRAGETTPCANVILESA
jgi:D-ribose pyranose/furanose isomerase RbsD